METTMNVWLLHTCPDFLQYIVPRSAGLTAAELDTLAGNSAICFAVASICIAVPVLIIGLVAVLRADRKDLPAVLDSLGRWVRRRSK